MWRPALVVLLPLSIAARAERFVDDTGRIVTLDAPPARVVTLAPNLTEIVYALGAGGQLVATEESSDFPPEAKRLPRVADHQRVDLERLVALKPDLVLAWASGNTMRELAQLESAGIALFRLEPRRLDDVPRALERVGALLGRKDAARRRAQALREELAALRAAHAGAPPLRVFYQVWSRPLLTLNDEHLVSDVIRLCGGRNVFGGLAPLVPQVSSESVVAADPDAILTARNDDTLDARREPQASDFAAWREWRSISAVRGGWLFTLPGNTVVRAGPRIADGARTLCGALDDVRRGR